MVKEARAGDPVDEEIVFAVPGGVVDGAGVACVLKIFASPSEIRGSLHFATDDETVFRFGRDDAILLDIVEIADCPLGEVGVGGGEGGEVVGAEDVGGGLLEGFEVEVVAGGPDERGQEWRAEDAAREDAVLVGFAEGTAAGVEGFGDFFDGEDADAGREGVVEGPVEIGRGDRGFEGEAGDLAEGVDSGVGAVRSLGGVWFRR